VTSIIADEAESVLQLKLIIRDIIGYPPDQIELLLLRKSGNTRLIESKKLAQYELFEN
jgi:hypothetical protein